MILFVESISVVKSTLLLCVDISELKTFNITVVIDHLMKLFFFYFLQLLLFVIHNVDVFFHLCLSVITYCCTVVFTVLVVC